MFLYLMLNKPNYRKSQLNQSLSTQIQLKYPELNIKWGKKYALISWILLIWSFLSGLWHLYCLVFVFYLDYCQSLTPFCNWHRGVP